MRQDSLIGQLAKITGAENLFSSPEDTLPYAISPNFGEATLPQCLPLAVASPRHLGQLGNLVKFCHEEGLPISICGGNTGLEQKHIVENQVVILTTGLNRIIDIDAENRLAAVQAGVTCSALAKAAAEKGLFYPPNPGSAAISTVGGNIALNAAGPTQARYGSTANYLRSIRVMTIKGQIINCYAQNLVPGKAEAGYPLASLFCGSGGSLGIICEAELKLLPQPQTRRGCMAFFADNSAAALAAVAISASRVIPEKMDFMDKVCAQTVYGAAYGPERALLGLTLAGYAAEVAENMETCVNLLKANGAEDIKIFDNEEPCADAGLLPALHGTYGNFLFETVCCPPSRLPALLEGVEQIANSHGAPAAVFGHVGIARLHVAIFLAERPDAARKTAGDIFTIELVLNNRLESEKDAGAARRDWQEAHRQILDYSTSIKHLFDPGNLLPPVTGNEQ